MTDRRRAIVTGAASGIGAATMLELAHSLHDVVGIDINEAGVLRTAQDARAFGGRQLGLTADVSDEPALCAAFEQACAFLGGLDALATCAGVADTTPFMELTPETFRRIHDVNVIGTYLCLREAARRMTPGGRLCTVASVAGLRGGGLMGTGAYAASKGAVLALTKSAARSLAEAGVCVNSVAPGPTLTPMLEPAWRDDALRARIESMSAQHRAATAQEIACSIAFLLSPAASNITGATLVSDGGLAMY
jgi:NAD(P)-dependent dehydrogenase (short-subunit alcohol dehydrogenase family)